MPEELTFVREQTAAFNSGLKIIERIDKELIKIKIAYMSKDGYAIIDSLERLYAEVDPELNGDIKDKESERGEGLSLRDECNKMIDGLSIANENRENRYLTRPVLMTREIKDKLYNFELWIRNKLKEKGMMMPKKDVEDIRLVMGKMG